MFLCVIFQLSVVDRRIGGLEISNIWIRLTAACACGVSPNVDRRIGGLEKLCSELFGVDRRKAA